MITLTKTTQRNTKSPIKRFDNWVHTNFKGVSVNTFAQLLRLEFNGFQHGENEALSNYWVDNFMESLFEYMAGNKDDEHTQLFETMQLFIDSISDKYYL